jgi:hypothetical protein
MHGIDVQVSRQINHNAPCRLHRKASNSRRLHHSKPSFITAAAGNFYDVLQVAKDADSKTIKKAFKKMALKYHPDVNNEVRFAN